MRIQHHNIASNPVWTPKSTVSTTKSPVATAADPEDCVSLSSSPASGWTQRVVRLAGKALAAAHTLCSLPGNVAVGLAVAASKGVEVQRSRAAVSYAASSAVVGGALGSLVGGPVGMVCGAFAGYIAGNIGNHLSQRSGMLERQLEAINDGVQPGQSGIKAAFRALTKGMGITWQDGQQAGQLTVRGMLDGAANLPPATSPQSESSTDRGIFKKTMGVVCGATGVLINAPGGAVLGALEALRETDEAKRGEIARPLMLVATNVGKVIPGAFVAALLGGPVGVAVGTAVGVVTASLTSIIDGKSGIHSGITRQVEKAVQEAHQGEPPAQDLRVFYRAGKGAVVGAVSGTRQGWWRGYAGGVNIADDLVSVPGDAIK